MSLRRAFLTAARGLATTLISGRAVGTTNQTCWGLRSNTNLAAVAATVTRVTLNVNTAGVNLYFVVFSPNGAGPSTPGWAAVSGPIPSVAGANDYAVNLPMAAGDSLGVIAAASINFRYVSTGGSGFNYWLTNPGLPVAGAAFPAGSTFAASPNSAHLAGYA